MRPRLSVLPGNVLEQIAHAHDASFALPPNVLYTEAIDQILLHTYRFTAGEEMDRGSGVHHLAVVAAVTIQLLSYIHRDIGEDNRLNPVRINKDELERDLAQPTLRVVSPVIDEDISF